jgi:hypothetical protein
VQQWLERFYIITVGVPLSHKKAEDAKMIPETLAIGPALGWVALALAGAFVFAVFLITAGDALYRRFERAQIKRELGKLKCTPLIAVCLSVSLLTSQLAFGQTTPAPKSSTALRYDTLFAAVSTLAVQAKKACKTEACAKATDELSTVIAAGKDKYSKGLLINETRKQFHTDLEAGLLKLRSAMMATLSEKEQKDLANQCPTCKTQLQLKPVQNEECLLCDEVFHTSVEICLLYTGICQTCLLICISVAAISYSRCINDYCPQDPNPDNTN